MQTIIRLFNFDVATEEGKAGWCALKTQLREMGVPTDFHSSTGMKGDYYTDNRDLDGTMVLLETEHVFRDQWNAAEPNKRLHDFAMQYYQYQPKWRRGYYLEQTPEMKEIRRNTCRCPYCGKQEPAQKGYVFCPHCLGNIHLKLEDLLAGATRMTPVDREDRTWIALQPAERDHLLPLFKAARTAATNTQIAEFLKKTKERARKKISRAYAERRGYERLIELGLGMLAMQNVIYYDHTGRFGFGWREPLSAIETSAVLEVISEFSFPYDIKTSPNDPIHNGRTLSGN